MNPLKHFINKHSSSTWHNKLFSDKALPTLWKPTIDTSPDRSLKILYDQRQLDANKRAYNERQRARHKTYLDTHRIHLKAMITPEIEQQATVLANTPIETLEQGG